MAQPIATDGPQMLTASDVRSDAEGADPNAVLTPAEQHALHRSAPLSTTEFKAVGRLVERGTLPLRRIFRRRHAKR
jgi:hypothetical protein